VSFLRCENFNIPRRKNFSTWWANSIWYSVSLTIHWHHNTVMILFKRPQYIRHYNFQQNFLATKVNRNFINFGYPNFKLRSNVKCGIVLVWNRGSEVRNKGPKLMLQSRTVHVRSKVCWLRHASYNYFVRDRCLIVSRITWLRFKKMRSLHEPPLKRAAAFNAARGQRPRLTPPFAPYRLIR
jgi:hypothetical protein